MDPDRLGKTLDAAIAAWSSGDAAGFAALFAEDGAMIVPGRRWVGPAAIQQAAADFFKDYDAAITVRQILIQEHRAAVEWRWRETCRQTGKSEAADDVIMVDFSAGQIVRWREYIDRDSPASY